MLPGDERELPLDNLPLLSNASSISRAAMSQRHISLISLARHLPRTIHVALPVSP